MNMIDENTLVLDEKMEKYYQSCAYVFFLFDESVIQVEMLNCFTKVHQKINQLDLDQLFITMKL